MSVFKTSCFLFLRNPRGGVEDLDRMHAAGFQGVFCNIGDHTPAEWEAVIRPRALQRGMFCGPWARTQGADGTFSTTILAAIVQCAQRWQSPLIVNSESELKGTGPSATTFIAETIQGYDAALSMEPQPFADVEWWPLKNVPVLPQVFGLGQNADWYAEQWHSYGIDCVFMTYGSYDWGPNEYRLVAPYSVYTADDMGGNYAAWSPTSSGYQGCKEDTPMPTPPPLTETQAPYTGPYALANNTAGHKSKGPTCEAMKRALSRAGAPSLPWGTFDQHYNQKLEDAWDWYDKKTGAGTGNNGYAKGRWERLRGMMCRTDGQHAGEHALDEYSQRLIRDEAAKPAGSKVPALGPVFRGGKSVLDHDLTHATSGIPDYPAFDDAFQQGVTIIAPEDLMVTRQSSANPGDAFYATGVSKLKWWFGHLDSSPSDGTNIKKGATMGKVAPNSIGGGPHVHVAIDARPLIGKVLEHHTNYSHGAPTVGVQLARALDA